MREVDIDSQFFGEGPYGSRILLEVPAYEHDVGKTSVEKMLRCVTAFYRAYRTDEQGTIASERFLHVA